MAYRYGERTQSVLFTQSIDDYVSADDPVRAYDAFVEQLDLEALGITINERNTGCPAYAPKAMLKLLLYGYSYGERSSRKLERAVHHNISFIWLMGKLKPDHKTIARFRRNHRQAIGNLLKQCARMCVELDLITGNTLFVDGSKFRANAGIGKTQRKATLQEQLTVIDQHIAQILADADAADEHERNDPSLVKMSKDLSDKQALQAKIKTLLETMDSTQTTRFNTTDPDSCIVKSRQGTHAGYNAQITVDDAHGLIVHSDVVNESNDINQFAKQIKAAEEIIEKQVTNACADNGYVNYEQLKQVSNAGTTVIVPSKKQAQHKRIDNPFDKEQFCYDMRTDQYRCPAGQLLELKKIRQDKQVKVYRIKQTKMCRRCQYYNQCTNSKHGREIHRYLDEEYRAQIAHCYAQPENQTIYARRKTKAELPFGHMKYNLKAGAFLLRGLLGARAELSLLGCCFNISRMITLLGVTGVIKQLHP